MDFLKTISSRISKKKTRENSSYSNPLSFYVQQSKIGEPYDFQRNITVKIDSQTNRLVGFPPEWEEILKKNGITTTLDTNSLQPIFKAYERAVGRKGAFCSFLS